MKRRLMLGRAGLAAATASVLATPAIAQANPQVRWRLPSSFPRSLDTLFGTAEQMAKRVAGLTDGRFQIRAFPAGEIVPGLAVLDAVQAGTVECGHTAMYYYVGKDPTFAAFTALPFGLNARQNMAWMQYGGGGALLNELLESYGTIAFPAGDTGAQMGGWFRREVKSIGDLDGLKFRIAGLAGQIFAKMGAVPTQVAAGDIYPALERGTIDAVEFVGPYDDEKLGFSKVAPYYYYPGFWEPGAHLHLLVNKAAYEALPPAYKEALQVAAAEANSDMLAKYDFLNPQALRRLVGSGTQLRPWSRDVLTAAWKAAHGLYDEMSAQNPGFKKMWESYRPFRDNLYTWFRVAENSYDSFALTASQTVR